MAQTRTFQRLQDRLAGRPVDETLHDGVPPWLDPPLRAWLRRALFKEPSTARIIALRLRRVLHEGSHLDLLVNSKTEDLLEVIDATLQLHPGWEWPEGFDDEIYGSLGYFVDLLIHLENDLLAAGSLYLIDADERRLTRRVDATVSEGAKKVISDSTRETADHLRSAWLAAYGLQPDPDKAYDEAVRAVESVACPLISPKADGRRTLGKAISDLRNDQKANNPKWALILPDASGCASSVEPLVAMMAALWEGQVSRHSGSTKSRRQTQSEAEAAIHLATTLVHWLSTGVLTART